MKKNRRLFYVIILLTFVSIFILNTYTVFISDDFSFMFDYRGVNYTEGIKRITSFSQIIISIKNLYLNVNGRIFPHFILQILLVFPKIIFNMLNSAVFVLLGILIYKLSLNNKKLLDDFKPYILILIYSLMYLMIPSFGMTTLWCSGSLNYLWMTTFSLIYIYYFLLLFNSEKKITLKQYIFIFLLGIISSNGVENASVGILFFTIISSILYFIKHKIKLWPFVALFSNLLGLFILLTGGNIPGRNVKFFSSFKDLIMLIINLIQKLGIYFIIYLLILGLLVIILLKNKKQKKVQNSTFINIYFCTSIISIFAMIVSPYIPERAFFFSYILLIICIIHLFDKLIQKNKVKIFITLILLIITMYVYLFVCFKDIKYSYDEHIKIEQIIFNSKTENKLDVIVPNYYKKYSKYSAFNNNYAFITTNPNSWANKWISFYYNIKSIKAIDN